MKSWSLMMMAGALLVAVSCSPVGGPYPGQSSPSLGQQGTPANAVGRVLPGSRGSSERATSAELRQLREQRAGVANEQLIHRGGGVGSGGNPLASAANSARDEGYNNQLPILPPSGVDYPYAIPVPGRKGWVFNHYTNRPVDVRGVESGRLIYDERDPENRNPDGTLKPVAEMPNKFRVP